jgi:hypothetical protein
VAEDVEAEIRQVERELAEARRIGARAEELAAVRDILYEDKWFRIATAVYAQVKRQFAEDGKAGELLEAAERRLFSLRLEVVEAPLLKIETAVDREEKIAAVRCRAALDLGVEAVFEGVAPATGWKRLLRQARQQAPTRQRTSNTETAGERRRTLSMEAKKKAGWIVF